MIAGAFLMKRRFEQELSEAALAGAVVFFVGEVKSNNYKDKW